ncbi:hypothetical protein [Paenibacillus massiliensis]|nr:hypothetical protein [Paenibacillus massiliensis]
MIESTANLYEIFIEPGYEPKFNVLTCVIIYLDRNGVLQMVQKMAVT